MAAVTVIFQFNDAFVEVAQFFLQLLDFVLNEEACSGNFIGSPAGLCTHRQEVSGSRPPHRHSPESQAVGASSYLKSKIYTESRTRSEHRMRGALAAASLTTTAITFEGPQAVYPTFKLALRSAARLLNYLAYNSREVPQN